MNTRELSRFKVSFRSRLCANFPGLFLNLPRWPPACFFVVVFLNVIMPLLFSYSFLDANIEEKVLCHGVCFCCLCPFPRPGVLDYAAEDSLTCRVEKQGIELSTSLTEVA